MHARRRGQGVVPIVADARLQPAVVGGIRLQLRVVGAIDPHLAHGAIPLVPAGQGLPDWLGGVIDTRCIGTLGDAMAFADATGSVYVSPDAGQSWSLVASGIASPSSVLVV